MIKDIGAGGLRFHTRPGRVGHSVFTAVMFLRNCVTCTAVVVDKEGACATVIGGAFGIQIPRLL